MTTVVSYDTCGGVVTTVVSYDTSRCRATAVSCDGPEVSYDGGVSTFAGRRSARPRKFLWGGIGGLSDAARPVTTT